MPPKKQKRQTKKELKAQQATEGGESGKDFKRYQRCVIECPLIRRKEQLLVAQSFFGPKLSESASFTEEIIFGQLSRIGYAPARVESYPAFDRILGGILRLLKPSKEAYKERYWYFEDNQFNMQRDDDTRSHESTELVEILKEMKCPFPATVEDFMGTNAKVLGPIVVWLNEEFLRQTQEKRHYQFYTDFFNTKHEDRSTAESVFLKALHRLNDTYHDIGSQMPFADLSFVWDKLCNGNVVLTEYFYYSRSGMRWKSDWGTEDQEWFGESKDKYRYEVNHLGQYYLEAFEKEIRKHVQNLIKIVERLHLADVYEDLNKRFQKESTLYYDMYLEYCVYKEQIEKVQPNTFTEFERRLQNVIKMTNDAAERSKNLINIIYEEKLEKQKRETELRANRDPSLPPIGSCPYKREEADILKEECFDIDRNILTLMDINKSHNTVREKFEDMHKRRESSTPVTVMDDDENSLIEGFSEIDCGIAEKCSMTLNAVSDSINEVTSAVVNDEEWRNAFMALTTDVCIFFSDWHTKAIILKQERRDLCRALKKTKLEARHVVHQLHFMAEETEILKNLNAMNRQAKAQMTTMEERSERFQLLNPSTKEEKKTK